MKVSCYQNTHFFFNSAHNALRYFLRDQGIRILALPYYICPIVWKAVISEGVKIIPYDIDKDFLPKGDFSKDTVLLYPNYFGIHQNNVDRLAECYPRLLVDNAQAFFAPKRGWCSLYSPRKFLAVDDGGILCGSLYQSPENLLSREISFENSQNFFEDRTPAFLKKNEARIAAAPLQLMSEITAEKLKHQPIEEEISRRREQFLRLHEQLKHVNHMSIQLHTNDVPMVYPILTEDVALRNRFLKQEISLLKFWEVDSSCEALRSRDALKLRNHLFCLDLRCNTAETLDF